jgi:hypothetical protein
MTVVRRVDSHLVVPLPGWFPRSIRRACTASMGIPAARSAGEGLSHEVARRGRPALDRMRASEAENWRTRGPETPPRYRPEPGTLCRIRAGTTWLSDPSAERSRCAAALASSRCDEWRPMVTSGFHPPRVHERNLRSRRLASAGSRCAREGRAGFEGRGRPRPWASRRTMSFHAIGTEAYDHCAFHPPPRPIQMEGAR